MSDNPITTNPLASTVNSILKGVIEGASEKEVEALILAATPQVVAIPVVGLIYTALVDAAVSWLGQYFYIQIANAVTSIIIDAQVGGEESAANKAFQNLQSAVQSGDKAAIDLAGAKLDMAYADLIGSDGSASA